MKTKLLYELYNEKECLVSHRCIATFIDENTFKYIDEDRQSMTVRFDEFFCHITKCGNMNYQAIHKTGESYVVKITINIDDGVNEFDVNFNTLDYFYQDGLIEIEYKVDDEKYKIKYKIGG